MQDFDVEKIINEWSYRVDRGYPRVEKPEDLSVLQNILKEEFRDEFARNYMKSIRDTLNEVALGLNNSSLRHKSRYDKYIKKLIKILKKDGEVKLERTVSYTDESEDDTTKIKIPVGEKVEVHSQDQIIGKIIKNLKRLLKYGPDFTSDEEAQKALRKVEEFFTYEDGTYKRVIPVNVKGNIVLLKLNDISKDTVTDEEEEEQGEEGAEVRSDMEDKMEKPKIKKKKRAKAKAKKKDKHSETDELSLDLGESDDPQKENSNNEGGIDLELPDGVVELFGDTYAEGDGTNHATGEDLTGEKISEDSEDEGDSEGESHKSHVDTSPSKYKDRRHDGKDDKYPDREYREFDPESDEEEEEKDDDYRHDKGDEEQTQTPEEEGEEETEGGAEEEDEEAEETGEEGENVEEIYEFNFDIS